MFTTGFDFDMGLWGALLSVAVGIVWGPIIGAAVSGLIGASNARSANKAAAAAAQPQKFEEHATRAPWAPAIPQLEEALGISRDIFDRARNYAPPPRLSTAGIRGASPELRAIANAMRERALTSSFIPDMQDRLSSFMEGPNPMMQSVYDRAMNYKNPMLDMLVSRGMGGGFDQGRPQLQGFISGLLGGQQQLGQPPPMAPPPPGMQMGAPPPVMQPPPMPYNPAGFSLAKPAMAAPPPVMGPPQMPPGYQPPPVTS